MRDKGQVQTVLDLPSPSTSVTTTDENTQSESESAQSPVRKVEPVAVKKKGKKVNFSSPPKWRIKHVVGKGGNKSERTALKSLSSNTKRLVGRGSPRIPTVGKRQKSQLKQTVITDTTSPLSTQKLSRQNKVTTQDSTLHTIDQGTQTEVTPSLDYKMCTEEEPPVEYWRTLAEQRRVALSETLQENEELYTEVGSLKRQVTELESTVKDLQYFAMMYKLATDNDS